MGKVSIQYLSKFIRGASIDEATFNKMEIASLRGVTHIDIPDADLKRIEDKYSSYQIYEKQLRKTAELNNQGKDLEQSGNIPEAIEIYERNIQIGYPATYSFDRLMILYHRQKDFANEKRVLQKAINIFSKNPSLSQKYKDRLSKLSKNEN